MKKNQKSKLPLTKKRGPLTNNNAYRFLKFDLTYPIKSRKKLKISTKIEKSRITPPRWGAKITADRFLKIELTYPIKSRKKCITSFSHFMTL